MTNVTDDDDVFALTPYIPRLVYRDLLLPVDRNHADELRARDLELFAKHGMFFRRQLPGEFDTEVMARMGYVVVDFSHGKWHRQLGKRRALTAVKQGGTRVR